MKRLFDIIASIIFIILFAPILLVLCFLVRRKMGSPIIFSQVRPGLNARPFTMIKFRSMIDAYDEKGEPLPDSERLTRFGKFLRSSSIDELPEIWNVLKGDMSLVGPRPLLMEYVPLYTPEQAKRMDIRPGVTGWAQVNGRNAISWEKKFEMDVWYVENRTLWLDIKIIFMTLKKIIIKEGISADGEATMSKFTGTKPENFHE